MGCFPCSPSFGQNSTSTTNILHFHIGSFQITKLAQLISQSVPLQNCNCGRLTKLLITCLVLPDVGVHCTSALNVTSSYMYVLTTVLNCHTHHFSFPDSFQTCIYRSRSHLTKAWNRLLHVGFTTSPLPFIKCDFSCAAVTLFYVFTFSDEQQPYFHLVVLWGEFVMEVFNSESCRPECETAVILALPEAPEPSFREKSAQQGRLQTDRVLTQLLQPHGSALHLSLSANSLVHGWGNQRFRKTFFSLIVLC